jgi:sodium pump decarboxylase gamma subunit
MISQGLVYMVLGMAVVFAFLTVLVTALKIASRIVSVLDRRYPLKEKPGSGLSAAVPEGASGEDEAIAAVIGAVVVHDPSLLQLIPKSLPVTYAAIPPSPDAFPFAPEGDQNAGKPVRNVNPWALSGRQSVMKMRSLVQRGVLKR